jgi:hypothetical protein
MTVKTVADVVPNGAATPLVPNSPHTVTEARWVQISANGTTIRYGDSNVSASRGARIANGTQAQVGFGFQEGQGPYDLSQIYVFATGSDSVSITFGV